MPNDDAAVEILLGSFEPNQILRAAQDLIDAASVSPAFLSMNVLGVECGSLSDAYEKLLTYGR